MVYTLHFIYLLGSLTSKASVQALKIHLMQQ